jgi:hypothetical protein
LLWLTPLLWARDVAGRLWEEKGRRRRQLLGGACLGQIGARRCFVRLSERGRKPCEMVF